MAEQIVDILHNPLLAEKLCTEASNEIRNLTWDAAARKCLSVYNAVGTQMGQNN
jgi:hypothetical protein